MRKIRFTGKLDYRKDQKFYVEEFRNYQDLLRTIEARQPECEALCSEHTIRKLKDKEGSDWYGDGWDGAVKKLTEGWDAPVKRMKDRFENLSKAQRDRAKSKPYANQAGFAPIVPNALMNLPNSMLDVKRVKVPQKILNCIVVIDRACGNSTAKIEEKMAEQLSWIAGFEAMGYRCRISVAMFPVNGDAREKELPAMLVKIKDEGQPFDIKRVAYPMVAASMLRVISFAWVCSTETKDSLGKRCWDSGYGRSFEYWGESRQRDVRKAFTEGMRMGKAIVFGFDDTKESIEKQISERL